MGDSSAAQFAPEAITSGASTGDVAPRGKASDGPTKVPFVNHGAACDGQVSGACIMTTQQRRDLILLLQLRVMSAEGNYKTAIERQRVTELLRKEEDLSWLALLVLEVVSYHTISALTAGIKALRAGSLAKLEEVASKAALRFEEMPRAGRWVRSGLEALDPESVKGGVKVAIDKAKKGTGGVKIPVDGKDAQVAYLNTLQGDATLGYQAIRETLPAVLNDLELLAAFDSFDGILHTVEKYEAALAEKLDRLKSSGVNEIGRKTAMRDQNPGDRFVVREKVLRDTRVIWVVHGGVLELRFESQDAKYLPDQVPDGLVAGPWNDKPEFGHPGSQTQAAELGDVVPSEFMAAAIARHRQFWGEEPHTVTLNNVPSQRDPTGEGQWLLPHTNKANGGGSGAAGAAVGSPTATAHSQATSGPGAEPIVKLGDPADVFLPKP